VLFLIGLVVKTFDSFGISTQIDLDTARRLAPMVGAFYDRSMARPQRDNIVVVVFDDQAVNALSTTDEKWKLRTLGPSYADQSAIVSAARDAGAMAVFFDISYSRQVENDLSARLLAANANQAGTEGLPVFFGPIGASTPIGAWRKGLEQVDVAWRASRPDDYPFSGLNGRPLAAWALYEAACAHPERARSMPNCSAAASLAAPNGPAGGASPDNMILTWGSSPPADMAKYWDERTVAACRTTRTVWEGVTAVATSFAREVLRAEPKFRQSVAAAGRCAYHLYVSGDLVVRSQGDPRTSAALRDLFAGRIVLVGAGLVGSSDFAEAPGIGHLPGVFQHAMALDNLMVMGATYKRSPPNIFRALDWSDIVEFALVVVSAMLISWSLAWRNRADLMPISLRVTAAILAPLVVVFSSAIGAYFLFNWSAGNVLAVLAAAFAGFSLASKEPWEKLTEGAIGWGAVAGFAILAICLFGGMWLLLTRTVS
jgi:hypothetical protein